jgi:Ca2+-binding EF-hand superfamily protein
MGGGTSKQDTLSTKQIQNYVKQTGFAESEIEFLHLRFRTICSNHVSLSQKDLDRDLNLKSNPYILRVFKLMPKNGMGEVTFETFINTAMIFREGKDLKKKLSFIFNLFDFNMDNTLDVDELKSMVMALKPELSETDCDDLIKTTIEEILGSKGQSQRDRKIRTEDFVAYASKLPGIDKLLVLNLTDDLS